ncbi:MAG TPA: LysR family transcriptional regulator [Burkholderiaceae bacterium]|nr:LysR family transcriptional regulator [Burkholderiaceae bacterium]
MHLRLDDVALFVRVAELGTLSAAARERDVSISQVTRSLARLEGQCGARLMHRSTHGLSLTDEGDTLLAYGRRLLETADELGGELSGKLGGPSGWVRVSVSQVVAETVVAPTLAGLYERHPELHVDLTVDDRVVDLARDGIDVAIRTGELDHDTLVARRLGQFGRTLVASPLYLERFGTPRSVAELDRHRLIAYTANPQMNRWPLFGGANAGVYQARGHTRSDSIALTLTLVRQGVGIGRVMDLLALPLIRRGELAVLLPDQIDPQNVPIHALMLHERHRLPKVRACIDYWAENLAVLQTT